jgi:hypothetical protein
VASPDADSLIRELNKVISEASVYENVKLKRVGLLKNILNISSGRSAAEEYNLNLKIYEEYKTFNYDSAFLYVNKLLTLPSNAVARG